MKMYQEFLFNHAFVTIVVFVIGRALQRGIGAGSETRRIHGKYVLWWSVGGFAIGGPLALITRADLPLGAAGFACFCLLAGWLIGTLHGAVVLARRRAKTPELPPPAHGSDV